MSRKGNARLNAGHNSQASKRYRAITKAFPGRGDVGRVRGQQVDALVNGGGVLPKGTCPSGKLRYETERDARKALEVTQRLRQAQGARIMEQRVYGDCDRGCGGWHTTKKAEWKARPA